MKHLKLSKIIAHRGAPRLAPENTLAALIKAAELGAKWVEFDVMVTRDFHSIIFHDHKLNRTTNGRGTVEDTAWPVIQNLDAGSWFGAEFSEEKVPSFAQYIKKAAELNMGVNIELKGNHATAKILSEHVVAELSEYWHKDLPLPLVSSSSVNCLTAIWERAPELLLGIIIDKWDRNILAKMKRYHCVSCHSYHKILNRDRVAQLKDQGKYVLAYTVNERERALELFDFGVDAIFSDNLDLLELE